MVFTPPMVLTLALFIVGSLTTLIGSIWNRHIKEMDQCRSDIHKLQIEQARLTTSLGSLPGYVPHADVGVSPTPT